MPWVPTPRYMLRRHCVLKLVARQPTERAIEVGCGAGDLLLQLARRKLIGTGLGVEMSEQARLQAIDRVKPVRDRVQITDTMPTTAGTFDLLIACEVLEHIEDDVAALNQWADQLKPGGRMILSVPAHQKRWDASDVWAGHFRRYERDMLRDRMTNAGMRVEVLWNYGYPWANITEQIRRRQFEKRLAATGELVTAQRTALSGIERSKLEQHVSVFMNAAIVAPMAWSQMLFLNRDWGNGYLAMATRTTTPAMSALH